MMTEKEFKLLCNNLSIFITNRILGLTSLLFIVISSICYTLSHCAIICAKNVNNIMFELSNQTQYIEFKNNIRNKFEEIRNNITTFINTDTWYPIQENVFNYTEEESISEFNNDNQYRDIPTWVLQIVPPSNVLIFGKHIFDKNYKKDMYDKYPMYTVEEIIKSLLGDNLEFPSYEKWLEDKEENSDEASQEEEQEED